jgi:hypothetical protein
MIWEGRGKFSKNLQLFAVTLAETADDEMETKPDSRRNWKLFIHRL